MVTGESICSGRSTLSFEGMAKEVRDFLLASVEEPMLLRYGVGVVGVMRGPLERWKCPPLGWVKINVDVSVNIRDRRAVIGGVIQDDRMVALGRGQDLVLMEFEDPLVELLDMLEEEAPSLF
ncbi:hypothetical protein V6N13_148879 [Hibiscus sabdariffa]